MALTLKMSSTSPLPFFRFHPKPLETKAIIPIEIVCRVCLQHRPHKYQGPFYSDVEVEDLCPWCIADGSAAAKYRGEFHDKDSVEGPVGIESIEELIHRTPGYLGLQEDDWPIHCGEICEFLNYAPWTQLNPFLSELMPDLERIAERLDTQPHRLIEELESGHSLQSYLFRCSLCGSHRLAVDSH